MVVKFPGSWKLTRGPDTPFRVSGLFCEGLDSILLDRIIPGMDGIEFCQQIKKDERWKLIPVIMQTAASRPQEIREGIEAGVFYYLLKPLAIDRLLSILASA